MTTLIGVLVVVGLIVVLLTYHALRLSSFGSWRS